MKMQRRATGSSGGDGRGGADLLRRAALRRMVIGLVMAVMAGCGMVRTKAEWWARLEQNGFKYPGNRLVVGVSREDFLRIMGKPDKIQAIGEHTYWYYRCRDGHIQMVMETWFLERGQVATKSINEF